MRKASQVLVLFILAFSFYANAQENDLNVENSAEVFLEAYSDSFQEKFFEALKQKGIENYDRAINLFLECKLIDATNHVVDHELAKTYFLDKQVLKAQEFAIEALLAEPENLWYLNTLVSNIYTQGGSLSELDSTIPMNNTKLKENLVIIYYKKKQYAAALAVVQEMKKSDFTLEMTTKINDSIKKDQTKQLQVNTVTKRETEKNPLENLKAEIETFIQNQEFEKVLELSGNSLEEYPSQPYFYFAHGLALNKNNKFNEAIDILEAALDYFLDDVALQNKIYNELAIAHTGLNNVSKANMYLSKLKPGF